MKENYHSRFKGLWAAHQARWDSSISLVASENVLSDGVRSLLASDIGNRVAEGPRGARWFPGLPEYDEIEKLGEEVCKELFDCESVELRPISGTIANIILYRAVCQPGDSIASLSIGDGGHTSMSGTLVRTLEYTHVRLPFSTGDLNLNLLGSLELVNRRRPRLLLLGGSVLLFPQPVAELAEAVHSYGGIVAFDASHVAGLIAGDQYPNALRYGADLMTFSTCKTIPGPQHALVVGSAPLMKSVSRIAQQFHSGYHLHETVAAILALIEMQEFGKWYAEAVCKNAKALAESLKRRGFKVLTDRQGRHTATHMLLVDATDFGGGAALEGALEDVGIFVNRNLLPGEAEPSPLNPQGVRIGTQEVTRMGMRETDMEELAQLMAETVAGQDKISLSTRVASLRGLFNAPQFQFPDV